MAMATGQVLGFPGKGVLVLQDEEVTRFDLKRGQRRNLLSSTHC